MIWISTAFLSLFFFFFSAIGFADVQELKRERDKREDGIQARELAFKFIKKKQVRWECGERMGSG